MYCNSGNTPGLGYNVEPRESSWRTYSKNLIVELKEKLAVRRAQTLTLLADNGDLTAFKEIDTESDGLDDTSTNVTYGPDLQAGDLNEHFRELNSFSEAGSLTESDYNGADIRDDDCKHSPRVSIGKNSQCCSRSCSTITSVSGGSYTSEDVSSRSLDDFVADDEIKDKKYQCPHSVDVKCSLCLMKQNIHEEYSTTCLHTFQNEMEENNPGGESSRTHSPCHTGTDINLTSLCVYDIGLIKPKSDTFLCTSQLSNTGHIDPLSSVADLLMIAMPSDIKDNRESSKSHDASLSQEIVVYDSRNDDEQPFLTKMISKTCHEDTIGSSYYHFGRNSTRDEFYFLDQKDVLTEQNREEEIVEEEIEQQDEEEKQNEYTEKEKTQFEEVNKENNRQNKEKYGRIDNEKVKIWRHNFDEQEIGELEIGVKSEENALLKELSEIDDTGQASTEKSILKFDEKFVMKEENLLQNVSMCNSSDPPDPETIGRIQQVESQTFSTYLMHEAGHQSLTHLKHMLDEMVLIFKSNVDFYNAMNKTVVTMFENHSTDFSMLVSAYENKSGNSGYGQTRKDSAGTTNQIPCSSSRTETAVKLNDQNRNLQACLEKARLVSALQGKVGHMKNRAENFAAVKAYEQTVAELEKSLLEYLQVYAKEAADDCAGKISRTGLGPDSLSEEAQEEARKNRQNPLRRSDTFVVKEQCTGKPPNIAHRRSNFPTLYKMSSVNTRKKEGNGGKEAESCNSDESIKAPHSSPTFILTEDTWGISSGVLEAAGINTNPDKKNKLGHQARDDSSDQLPQQQQACGSASYHVRDAGFESDTSDSLSEVKESDDLTYTSSLLAQLLDYNSADECKSKETFSTSLFTDKKATKTRSEKTKNIYSKWSIEPTRDITKQDKVSRHVDGSSSGKISEALTSYHKQVIPSDIDNVGLEKIYYTSDFIKGNENLEKDSGNVSRFKISEESGFFHDNVVKSTSEKLKMNKHLEIKTSPLAIDKNEESNICVLETEKMQSNYSTLTCIAGSSSGKEEHFFFSESTSPLEKARPLMGKGRTQVYKLSHKKWKLPSTDEADVLKDFCQDTPAAAIDWSSSDEDLVDDLLREVSPSDLLKQKQKRDVDEKLLQLNQYSHRRRKSRSPLRQKTHGEIPSWIEIAESFNKVNITENETNSVKAACFSTQEDIETVVLMSASQLLLARSQEDNDASWKMEVDRIRGGITANTDVNQQRNATNFENLVEDVDANKTPAEHSRQTDEDLSSETIQKPKRPICSASLSSIDKSHLDLEYFEFLTQMNSEGDGDTSIIARKSEKLAENEITEVYDEAIVSESQADTRVPGAANESGSHSQECLSAEQPDISGSTYITKRNNEEHGQDTCNVKQTISSEQCSFRTDDLTKLNKNLSTSKNQKKENISYHVSLFPAGYGKRQVVHECNNTDINDERTSTSNIPTEKHHRDLILGNDQSGDVESGVTCRDPQERCQKAYSHLLYKHINSGIRESQGREADNDQRGFCHVTEAYQASATENNFSVCDNPDSILYLPTVTCSVKQEDVSDSGKQFFLMKTIHKFEICPQFSKKILGEGTARSTSVTENEMLEEQQNKKEQWRSDSQEMSLSHLAFQNGVENPRIHIHHERSKSRGAAKQADHQVVDALRHKIRRLEQILENSDLLREKLERKHCGCPQNQNPENLWKPKRCPCNEETAVEQSHDAIHYHPSNRERDFPHSKAHINNRLHEQSRDLNFSSGCVCGCCSYLHTRSGHLVSMSTTQSAKLNTKESQTSEDWPPKSTKSGEASHEDSCTQYNQSLHLPDTSSKLIEESLEVMRQDMQEMKLNDECTKRLVTELSDRVARFTEEISKILGSHSRRLDNSQKFVADGFNSFQESVRTRTDMLRSLREYQVVMEQNSDAIIKSLKPFQLDAMAKSIKTFEESLRPLRDSLVAQKKEMEDIKYSIEKLALEGKQYNQNKKGMSHDNMKERIVELTSQRDAEKVFHRITRQALRALERDHDRLREEYVRATCRRYNNTESDVPKRLWYYLNNQDKPQPSNNNHNDLREQFMSSDDCSSPRERDEGHFRHHMHARCKKLYSHRHAHRCDTGLNRATDCCCTSVNNQECPESNSHGHTKSSKARKDVKLTQGNGVSIPQNPITQRSRESVLLSGNRHSSAEVGKRSSDKFKNPTEPELFDSDIRPMLINRESFCSHSKHGGETGCKHHKYTTLTGASSTKDDPNIPDELCSISQQTCSCKDNMKEMP